MSSMRIPASLALSAVLIAMIYKVNDKPVRKPTDPPVAEVSGGEWKIIVFDEKNAEMGNETLRAASPRQLKIAMREVCMTYGATRIKADSLASKLEYDQACSELNK